LSSWMWVLHFVPCFSLFGALWLIFRWQGGWRLLLATYFLCCFLLFLLGTCWEKNWELKKTPCECHGNILRTWSEHFMNIKIQKNQIV
jgi:hypothetical protein